MNSPIRRGNYVLIILICTLVLTGGCVHKHVITSSTFENDNDEEKIPLRVGLSLSADFCGYSYTRRQAGETWIFELGDAFCENAKNVVKRIFSHTILISEGKHLNSKNTDALIIPRIVQTNLDYSMRRDEPKKALVLIEWTFLGPAEKTIWITTIMGESSVLDRSIIMSSKMSRKAVQMAVDDVFRRSQESIMSSQAIRAFAMSQD